MIVVIVGFYKDAEGPYAQPTSFLTGACDEETLQSAVERWKNRTSAHSAGFIVTDAKPVNVGPEPLTFSSDENPAQNKIAYLKEISCR